MLRILLSLTALVVSSVSKPLDDADEKFAFAFKHVPEYRFDSGAKPTHCWPDEAIEKNSGTCKDFNVEAPLYYQITDCQGKYRKLSWWLFYGKEYTCNPQQVPNDWEHININFIKDDSTGKWTRDSVTFFQSDGWYTRKYSVYPVTVYVGKTRHGNFDDWCPEEKCHEPCEYWNDFRDDSQNGRHWFPINIQDLSVVPNKLKSKIQHQHFSNPQLNSCFGFNFRCTVGACGCWRNNHEFPAPFCNV